MDELTTGQAGRLLGIGGKSVRRAIVEGRMPGRRVGPLYVVTERAVEEYRSKYPLRPGRPKGSRDRYPRVRRTRRELEAASA